MDVAMQRKGKELELIARQPNPLFRAKREIPLRLVAACLTVASPAFAAQGQAKQSWKSVEFAIVKFNDEALFAGEREGRGSLRNRSANGEACRQQRGMVARRQARRAARNARLEDA